MKIFQRLQVRLKLVLNKKKYLITLLVAFTITFTVNLLKKNYFMSMMKFVMIILCLFMIVYESLEAILIVPRSKFVLFNLENIFKK